MKKVILAFLLGVVFGYALAVALLQKDMPQYTDPSMLDSARQALDGSTRSVQQGMKNLLP